MSVVGPAAARWRWGGAKAAKKKAMCKEEARRGRVVVVAHVNLRWNWPRFSRRDGIQCDECRRFECL